MDSEFIALSHEETEKQVAQSNEE